MDLVSIIIPLYNKEKAIKNTVLSVLKQTYADIEIVIVDDGSTDNSREIVEKLAETDDRIFLYHKENGGVSSARNYGLKMARGKWVTFLDADDELMPDNVEVLVNLVNKFGVKIGAANFLDTCDGITSVSRFNYLHFRDKVVRNFILELIKSRAFFCNGAIIFRKDILGDRPYNESLSRFEDAEFELRLFNKYPIAITTKPVVLIHREMSESSKLRKDPEKDDYIFNMNFRGKTIWQKIKMGQFILEGVNTYKGSKEILKKKYGNNFYYAYIYYAIFFYYKVINKIRKMTKTI